MALWRQIENRKAAATQSNFERPQIAGSNNHRSTIVRPAVRQRIGGLFQKVRGNRAVGNQNAEDSTHE